ncbi:VanZ family protein [Rhodohalobacter sp. 8-1]|uniref:VanZ family protein n=1 Tax=Rhodohalobacter sp. 8-1 TaxID=3131972 RepID=UPI0030ECA352
MIGKLISFLVQRKYVVYFLFIAITAITLLLTLLPPDNFQGQAIFSYDKIGHFLMFFGWSFMFGLSLILYSRQEAPLLFIFVAGTLFGISIEFMQEMLTQGRTASWTDAAADSAGTLTAVILLWWIKTKYRQYLRPILSQNSAR